MALLATVAAHQLIHLIFDLALGWKRARSVRKSSIHVQLLCDESSPLSVAAATFRRDELDFLRFRRILSSSVKIVRDSDRIHRIVLFQLFFLLLAGPLINLICILPTLEYNRTVTFAEAGFANVSLGINPNSSLISSDYAARCYRYHSRFASAEEYATLARCRSMWSSKYLPSPSSNFSLTVELRSNSELSFRLFFPGQKIARELEVTGSVFIPSENNVYRLRTELSEKDMENLLNLSFNVIHDNCPTPDGKKKTTRGVRFYPKVSRPNDNDIFIRGTVLFKCSGYDNFELKIILLFLSRLQDDIASQFSIVETERFEVARLPKTILKRQDLEWKDGRTLPMLIIRRNYIQPGVLIILTVVIVLVRTIASCLCNNDVYDAIDYLLAMKLGSPFEMIRNPERVNYGLLDDMGEKERYGIEAVCSSPHVTAC